jgi:hypothetical protein
MSLLTVLNITAEIRTAGALSAYERFRRARSAKRPIEHTSDARLDNRTLPKQLLLGAPILPKALTQHPPKNPKPEAPNVTTCGDVDVIKNVRRKVLLDCVEKCMLTEVGQRSGLVQKTLFQRVLQC